MERLKGKVAIVTGAAKGLGEADARLFAAEGARVVLTDVDVEGGERVAREIGGAARFVRQDVREEAGWVALIDEVMAKEGRLDVLVNNAGVVEAGTIESTSAEDYRFVMAVSADGTFFGCKHAIPAMRQSGGGSIVNMASIASIQGESLVAAYCAAKGAVEALTRAVAVHCTQHKLNIRCNSVHPSGIDTPMVRAIGGKVAAAGVTLPMDAMPAKPGVIGAPNDIAYAVLYLASDESRFVNGQRLVVDNTISVTSGHVAAGAMAFKSLHHASLTTADAERLSAFYEQHLGFARVLQTEWDGGNPLADAIYGVPDTAVRMVMLKAERTFLEIFEFRRPVKHRADDRSVVTPGYTHFAMITDDIDADFQRLRAAGAPFNSPPQDVPGLCRAAYYRDPDGNLVELLQPDPGGPFAP